MSTTSTIDEASPLMREILDLTHRRKNLAEANVPLPGNTRIFTVSNQKGGVGKTTTTVNIAAALAKSGARVLVIDLQEQEDEAYAALEEHLEKTGA